MNYDFASLNLIRDKEILEISTEISLTIPILVSNDIDKIEIPIKIIFDNYTLLVYNKWKFKSPTEQSVEMLKDKKITGVTYTIQTLTLMIDNVHSINIDMSDDGFMGPESLVLYGPKNMIVVWN